MTDVLFPIWQRNWHEYSQVCAYLGLTPSRGFHERLLNYMHHAPLRSPVPEGFARHLAKLPLTRFSVARLDLVTKWLYPAHPVRHFLNAVIALHECDGRGFAELAESPVGMRLWFCLFAWGVGFALSLTVTAGWLAGQFAVYVMTGRRHAASIAGKTVLITGVGRGLGQELMSCALERGASVIGTVRSRESIDHFHSRVPAARLRLVSADLARPGDGVDALHAAGVDPACVDLAVLCAGTKHAGDSLADPAAVRATFEVNLFSAVEIAQWFCVPGRRKTLVLVSSMGRWHGMHSTCGYNASKAALSIWGESLEMDLARSRRTDCRVMVVEPGLFASGMVSAQGIGRLLLVSPRRLADAILAAAVRGERSLRYPFWFALLTWAVLLAGRAARSKIFARHVKS